MTEQPSGNIPEERRRHRRFATKGSAVAVNPRVLGHITDISMGGLCFWYAFKDDPAIDTNEIDIFLTGEREFFIEKLPVRIVRDHPTPSASPFSTIIMRRRGVEFTDLSPAQRSQLEYFIKNFTLHTA